GQHLTLTIPEIASPDTTGHNEVLLNVEYRLKESRPMLEAGHCVAYQQLPVKEYSAFSCTLPSSAETVEVHPSLGNLKVRASGTEYTFNKHTGFIDRITMDGIDMLAHGHSLEPNFWRPPTDNDYGVNLQRRFSLWRDPEYQLEDLAISGSDTCRIILTRYSMNGLPGMQLSIAYNISGTGQMRVEQKLTQADTSADIPGFFRFGMKTVMPRRFSTICYYGKGPSESYLDRNASQLLGIYRQSVSQQYYPYIRPQETGNKTSLRWWKVTDDGGCGLCFHSDREFSASALDRMPMTLDDGPDKYIHQSHGNSVEPLHLTAVNIDGVQQGLGCIDSWKSEPRQQYM
ncbi:MAG: DUF4981 domain-containing protein, partial [Muribaculaceae bacterium]|nr:DUF4981 domain-containing protein [Muribaculaceae bacterium]